MATQGQEPSLESVLQLSESLAQVISETNNSSSKGHSNVTERPWWEPLSQRIGSPRKEIFNATRDADVEQFNADTTVIAMISFGNATKQNHVQRCVRSVRARGEWKGRIVIVTDSPQNYAALVAQDPLVHLITPRREDWQDLPKYTVVKLKFKRFKTLLIDYMMADPSLQDVGMILYTDVDIVVCKPIVPWIKRRWEEGRQVRLQSPPELSFAYMYDTGNGGKAAHSGVILLHSKLSNGCLKTWRERMDAGRLKLKRDQFVLRHMRKDGPKVTGCRIPVWPRKELIFPLQKDFEKRRFEQFVHITNTFHAGQTDALIQKAFLEDALDLTETERNDPNSLAIVPEGF